MRKIIFILSILAISCSPQKRVARIIANNPDIIKTDTIIRIDTVTTKEVNVIREIIDTALFNATINRPIIIDSGLVRTVIYRTENNRYIVDSKCKSDTIFVYGKDLIRYYPYEIKQNFWNWKLILLMIGICILSILLAKLFR